MDEDDFEKFLNEFGVDEFDYVVGGLAHYCMTDITKGQLWSIIEHTGDGFELQVSIEAQELLNNSVSFYYGRKTNG